MDTRDGKCSKTWTGKKPRMKGCDPQTRKGQAWMREMEDRPEQRRSR